MESGLNVPDQTSMTEVSLSLVFMGWRLWVWKTIFYWVLGDVIFAYSFHPKITWRKSYRQKLKPLKTSNNPVIHLFWSILDLAYQTCKQKLLNGTFQNTCTIYTHRISAHFQMCGDKLHVYNKIICFNFKSHHKSMLIVNLVVLWVKVRHVWRCWRLGSCVHHVIFYQWLFLAHSLQICTRPPSPTTYRAGHLPSSTSVDPPPLAIYKQKFVVLRSENSYHIFISSESSLNILL